MKLRLRDCALGARDGFDEVVLVEFNPDKIEAELAYLQIAIDKTAGPREQEAWGWLQERIAQFRAQPKENHA